MKKQLVHVMLPLSCILWMRVIILLPGSGWASGLSKSPPLACMGVGSPGANNLLKTSS